MLPTDFIKLSFNFIFLSLTEVFHKTASSLILAASSIIAGIAEVAGFSAHLLFVELSPYSAFSIILKSYFQFQKHTHYIILKRSKIS